MQRHGPRDASPQKADALHCKHAKGIPPCSNGNGTRLISRWASATPCLLDPATLKSFMPIAEQFRDIITKPIQRAGTCGCAWKSGTLETLTEDLQENCLPAARHSQTLL
jgi:hypothetical protein